MLRNALILLLLLHGLIHLIGLAKAFDLELAASLHRPIGRMGGLAWTTVTVLLLIAAVLVVRHDARWWYFAAPGILLSQVLIFGHWQDARFGTVANVLLAMAAVAGISVSRFRHTYQQDAATAAARTTERSVDVITAEDLNTLPPPVQRYVRASGALGKPAPRSMRLAFSGTIRSKDGPWMPFTSEQLNTFDPPARLFWMDATMKQLPTKGYHAFRDGHAAMRIKVLGLIPVFDLQGPELDTAETVTWFNDLCLFAPGALLDPHITWEALGGHRARATYARAGMRISADLVFDDRDRLVDFVSDDRYYLAPDGSMMKHRFSTPASDHHSVNGLVIPGTGETIWHLPDGAFTYGLFNLIGAQWAP
jgi:hypothetical protein